MPQCVCVCVDTCSMICRMVFNRTTPEDFSEPASLGSVSIEMKTDFRNNPEDVFPEEFQLERRLTLKHREKETHLQ